MASKEEIEAMGLQVKDYNKCKKCNKKITEDEYQMYNGYCESCYKNQNTKIEENKEKTEKENTDIVKKIMKKFNISKKETMQCPYCYKEYDDLTLHFCKDCDTSLSKKTKYLVPKKVIYSIIGIVLTIIIIILSYIGITNYIKEQKRIEKYNNDLSICYEVIKNESDFKKFTSIISEHTEETEFSSDAYKKLYQAIDERIENIKNGNDDEKLVNMLKEIKNKNSSNQTIANKYLKANGYSNINKVNKYIQEKKYIEAYDLLGVVITDNKDINKDITDLATNKQNEIKEQMLQQVITQGQEKINKQEYSSAKTLLEKYKDFGNQTIVDMYNKATNEVNRIEAEKKAQEETERRKQQEEERKRQQAELDAKKDKIIVDTNGKRIYKVCMASNRFSISGNFKGQGHFSIKLLDDNQEFYDLLVNEIGDYVVDTSTRVTKGDYYYVQIECSRGSWNLSWSGTYGD